MKKIAVLTPTYSTEYSLEFLSGVYDFFSDKEVQVLIAQSKFSQSKECIYDYQYWSSLSYLASSEIDGIIILSGIYCSSVSKDEYIEVLKNFFPNKPIVSSSIELDLPNVYSILVDTETLFFEAVEHLVKVHDCKKIAYMSSISTKSDEAYQRHESFLKAMKKLNQKIDDSLIFEGYFSGDIAKNEILSKVSKDNLNFDALICANDDMADGCIAAFSQLGIKVPEDVKVIGFDNSALSYVNDIKISTINQNIHKQGFFASELIMKLLNNHPVDKKNYVPLNNVYRHSCSCVPLENKKEIYKDKDGNIIADDTRILRKNDYNKNVTFKSNIFTTMDMIRSSDQLSNFYYTLPYIIERIDIENMFICFFPQSQKINSGDEFILPDRVKLEVETDRDKNTKIHYEPLYLNPHENLFPPSYNRKKGIYVLQPIFSGDLNYGYLVCKIQNKDLTYNNVYLKIIVTFLSQLYEYTKSEATEEILRQENTKLLKTNDSLSNVSKTDELTGILNRRGFYELAQKALDIAHEMESNGVVFFADMNGLKKINDTYGHVVGDKAIKALSQAIKKVFRKSDVIGRLSGDEFAIFANGMSLSQVDMIRHNLARENKIISEKNKFPFELSCCIGACEIKDSNNLILLLNKADVDLYEEKRKRYGKQ